MRVQQIVSLPFVSSEWYRRFDCVVEVLPSLYSCNLQIWMLPCDRGQKTATSNPLLLQVV